MGKFININTKILPLPRRLRPGFYGLTVIFYDTPERNTQILKQRSWGSRYLIATKTVVRRTLSGTRVRVGRGLGARAASVTPLRVIIPGAHVPILFLAFLFCFGCRHGFDFNRRLCADTQLQLRRCWRCSMRQAMRLNLKPEAWRLCLSAG